MNIEKERRAFEAHMRAKRRLFPLSANQHVDGTVEYLSSGTQHMWRGWLAAKFAVKAAALARKDGA